MIIIIVINVNIINPKCNNSSFQVGNLASAEGTDHPHFALPSTFF